MAIDWYMNMRYSAQPVHWKGMYGTNVTQNIIMDDIISEENVTSVPPEMRRVEEDPDWDGN